MREGLFRYLEKFNKGLLLGKIVPAIILLPVMVQTGNAQEFDILIKAGHLIDAKNQINAKMDVAITDGKIAKIHIDIPPGEAKKVVDADGLIVAPGLIDIHTHVFVGSKAKTFANGFSSVSPDDFSFRSGVTTVVDAGTSGWENFPLFKENIIDQSQTRVLAFLNIAGGGMSGDQGQENIDSMDPGKAALAIKNYPEILIGIKIGHYEGKEWAPFEKALEACKIADVPLLVECHLPQYPLQEQLEKMRPGDIITHTYEEIKDRMPIVDENGELRPFVLEAYKRGVLFDVGHGGAGFWFSQAVPAVHQGLLPNSFGTDLHRFSMNSGMKNMLNVMSKFLHLGMDLEDIISRASWHSAQSIKREDLGHLSKGAVADITLLRLIKGEFGFIDSGGFRIKGPSKLEAELTIREGRVVYDLNGLASKEY